MTFHTPPEYQGQNVSVGYSSDADGVYLRERDSTGRTVYYRALWAAVSGPWEPWNGAPCVDDDAWVRCERPD